MKHRDFRSDGYRQCSFCDKMIGQCMGFVVAGDMVLALRGQLALRQVRERCGTCVARHAAAREGRRGYLIYLWAVAWDSGRWLSWRLQRRFRFVWYPLQIPEEK